MADRLPQSKHIEYCDLGSGRLYKFHPGTYQEKKPMSVTTRRTAIAMLGLAPVTAVGAETFIAPPDRAGDLQSVAGAYQKERWAKAFENLAAELRRDSIEISSLSISAELGVNDIADVHKLTLSFRYKPEV